MSDLRHYCDISKVVTYLWDKAHIAAAIKSGAGRSVFYRATPTALTIAVPASMKNFPTEVLPQ